MKIFTFFIIFIFSQLSFSYAKDDQSLYCKRNLGYHFYCDTAKEKFPEDKNKISPKETESKYQLAQKEIKKMNKTLEDFKALAIVKPTQENIKRYITYQSAVMEKVSLFARNWQKTIWSNPQLDYTLKYPTGGIAKRAWTNRTKKIKKTSFSNLSKRYGIFFFYTSSCPYCHKFSPVVKYFGQKHRIVVRAVSLDHETLPEWPEYRKDQGQWKKFGLEGYPIPAVILFDSLSKKIIPISFGVIGLDELERRIFSLTNIGQENDY